MQQRTYRPPNVAGWEGGLSWLNTNTVQARFDAVVRVQYLQVLDLLRRAARRPPADDPGRDRRRPAFDRAYAAANSPWLSRRRRARR